MNLNTEMMGLVQMADRGSLMKPFNVLNIVR